MDSVWHDYSEVKPAQDGKYLFLMKDGDILHGTIDGDVYSLGFFSTVNKKNILKWMKKPESPEFLRMKEYIKTDEDYHGYISKNPMLFLKAVQEVVDELTDEEDEED